MKRTAIECVAAAAISLLLSLIVFAPLLGQLNVGWAGGDMLSTYVNSQAWAGFSYGTATQFGFPLGMNLNYFPGIDVTENTFAHLINAITGSPFIGINLLVVLSFPLVAALAYLCIRMTGLRGPIAIAFAVAFSFIPYHWGRALGHTYLSTLYSMVIGVALVLLIGSGHFERLRTGRSRARRTWFWIAIGVMVVIIAWTGVYYVAFTLLLGFAALLWRFAQRASWKSLGWEAVPFVGVGIAATLAFIPSLLTLRNDPPLVSLGERTAMESVTYAGNLAMAILPIPQSQFPRGGYYNEAVLRAFTEAPYGESNVITNFGTWVTALALIAFLVGLLVRSRRGVASPGGTRVSIGYVAYLVVVVLLLFVPWGVNFLFAEWVSAQIRGWNRLLPVLLLLFILGASAALRGTRIANRLIIAAPIALILLGLTAVDSVYPFRAAYAGSVAEAGAATDAARAYATDVNAAIPADCGVLQLPYMAYPENGVSRGVNDYDHFWTSITNDGKQWSYGAVKNTDAGVWAAQLPQVPTAEQMDDLRAAGFCAIHLDTKGYISEVLPGITGELESRYGAPVATGYDGRWLMYSIGRPGTITPQAEAMLRQPFISANYETVTVRDSAMGTSWWWTRVPSTDITLIPTSAAAPLHSVAGAIAAPPCGVLPVTVTLTADGRTKTTTVLAKPDQPGAFELTLDSPTASSAVLNVSAPGEGCPVGDGGERQFAQVLDLSPR